MSARDVMLKTLSSPSRSLTLETEWSIAVFKIAAENSAKLVGALLDGCGNEIAATGP